MDKFKNKYRNGTARLQSWDYGWTAYYFVTICTKNRKWYFGEVHDGVIELSNTGVLADVLWYELKNHFPFVELHSFCVMPNHIHGIIYIEDIREIDTTVMSNNNNPGQQRFQNQGKNTLSSVIGSYKSAVTKHSHRLGYEFGWQSRFHEHIIRDENSYNNISNYIINNASKWQDDELNKI